MTAELHSLQYNSGFILSWSLTVPFIHLLATGALGLASTALFAADKPGAQVYNETCIVCHDTGILHAPRMSDAKRWQKLVQEGLDELVPAALAGIRHMPPKGANPNLSDQEVANAVVWMVNQHGGQFSVPTPEQVKAWRARADRRKKH
jgi:cytochrome c5